ncbi:MAG: phenylalanine--tRNA ligase subunit beta [Thermodesulfobacteriota bacterium]
MRVSVNWLREFTPFAGDIQDLADRLTMLGLEVEEISRPFAGLEKVVVGKVVECARHPEADKLSLTRVDAGQGELLSIVCGAPNVAAGQTVAVALVGASLPNGLVIKKSKIRGAESLGMICAEDELGLGEGHAGIMVLDGALRAGTPLVESLNLDAEVLEVSITPNRADCLSVLGVAREAALAFGLPLTLPRADLREEGPGRAEDFFRIEIPEPELCPVYQARVLAGVKVGPSPDWLRWRLSAVGLRPINNIVDVTNYVMFELGQPLHAFDRRLLAGGLIRVARASEGMRFTTLDNQERALNANDLLIWDAEKPVALAGVMGGANTEMAADSTDVLLESAVFRPGSVRKTARRLGIPSESSYRFERGVDQPGSRLAMDRAAALMAEFSGGRVLPGVAVAEPRPWRSRVAPFRVERARDLLGLPVDEAFCRKTLEGVGCSLRGADGSFEAEAPSHRLDLEREVDLIEEVARVYGIDRIPAVLPRIPKSLDAVGKADTTYDFSLRLKSWARGAGLREAVNYSFVGTRDLDLLGLPQDNRVPVKNPLSEEQNVLRTALAPGLLQTVRQNVSAGAARVRAFELAHLFFPDPASDTTATEPVRLGLALYGDRAAEGWPQEDRPADYLDLKGLAEHLLAHLKLPAAQFAVKDGHPYLSPCVEATLDGEVLGELGRVKPELADAYEARKEVWIAELDADLLKRRSEARVQGFAALAKFPPVRRDVTFACPADLQATALLDAARGAKEKLLADVLLVNVYQPEPGGERNLSLRLTYRHAERTLKDAEADKAHAKVVAAVAAALPVRV